MSHQVIKLMLNQRQRSVDQICLRRHVQSMKIWVFLGSFQGRYGSGFIYSIREEAEKWCGERRERQSNKDAQRYLDVCLVVVTKPNPLLDPRAARAAETTVGGFGEPSSFNSGRGDISSRDVEAAHHLFSYVILDDCTSQRCLLDSDELNQCLWRRSGRGAGRPAAPVDGTIKSVMRAKLTTCDKWLRRCVPETDPEREAVVPAAAALWAARPQVGHTCTHLETETLFLSESAQVYTGKVKCWSLLE